VDFPIENGGSFHSYVNVYQRVLHGAKIDGVFFMADQDFDGLAILSL
jgi:hypothetical protein